MDFLQMCLGVLCFSLGIFFTDQQFSSEKKIYCLDNNVNWIVNDVNNADAFKLKDNVL